MLVLLTISVVATAIVAVRQVVSHGASEAIRIAAISISILVLGSVLQLMSPIGILAGVLGAVGFAAVRIDQGLRTRRSTLDQAVARASPLEARMLLHDRVDLLETPLHAPRRVSSVFSLAALTLVGLTSIFRGLDSAFPAWLFLGCLVLLLPSAHLVATILRSREVKYLGVLSAKLGTANPPEELP